jgi:phosphate uptake regulator
MLAAKPNALAKYIAQAQIRFTQARQIAVLNRWTEFYNASKAVIAARTELARAHADLQQLSIESDIKVKKKEAEIAVLEAEIEEAALRREEAQLRRNQLSQPVILSQPSSLSPEQQRILKKAEIEAELVRVRQDKTVAVEAAVSEEEGIRVTNMYDDRIIQLLERLRKYL